MLLTSEFRVHRKCGQRPKILEHISYDLLDFAHFICQFSVHHFDGISTTISLIINIFTIQLIFRLQ